VLKEVDESFTFFRSVWKGGDVRCKSIWCGPSFPCSNMLIFSTHPHGHSKECPLVHSRLSTHIEMLLRGKHPHEPNNSPPRRILLANFQHILRGESCKRLTEMSLRVYIWESNVDCIHRVICATQHAGSRSLLLS